MLPANSTVSILSVNFNEEMIAIATNVKEEEQKEVTKLRRKHSLGSNLVDSENLLGGGGVVKQESPEGEYFYDDEFCIHGDEENLVVAKESEELGGGVEGEESADSFEKVKVSEVKQGEESVKRVKKKSISGWFKELGNAHS